MIDEEGHDMGIDMRNSLEMSEEEFRYQVDSLMKQNKELAEKIVVYEEKLSSLKTFREIKKKEVKQLNENVKGFSAKQKEKEDMCYRMKHELDLIHHEIKEFEKLEKDKGDNKQGDDWGEKSQEGMEQELKEKEKEIALKKE